MSAGGPLAGLTVLDLGHVYAAPYAGLLLAHAGAKVIKVEPPGGEHLRKRGRAGGPAQAFAMLNTNKHAVTLDLKMAKGVEVFLRLVRQCDVVIENYRPGVAQRLGIGFAALADVNPRIVVAHSSGYGSTGPYRDLAAMDLSVQAMTGVVHSTGFPDADPVKAGTAVADFSAGIHLYGAIVTALYQRERTGKGDYVEVSMMESVFPSLMSNLSSYYATGRAISRTGNRHGGLSLAPYNVYRVIDGHVAIICESNAHWARLCEAMGRLELVADERYRDTTDRARNIDEVDHIVASWTSHYEKASITQLLMAAAVPVAPVRDLPEVADDPHLKERGFLRTISHPELGPTTVMGSPMRIGLEPIAPDLRPSGPVGVDNREIFVDWLGLSDSEFERLVDEGVFGG